MRWVAAILLGLFGACGGSNESGIPSFIDVEGRWEGSATFTNNCGNPACRWQGTLNPPSIIMDIEQVQNILTGTISVNLPQGDVLIDGNPCGPAMGTEDIQRSNSSVSGTQVTITQFPGFLFTQTWDLQIVGASEIAASMQGTLDSDATGCTGIVAENVSVVRAD